MKAKKKRFLISATEKDVYLLDKICEALHCSRSEFLIEVLFYNAVMSAAIELDNDEKTNKKEEN